MTRFKRNTETQDLSCSSSKTKNWFQLSEQGAGRIRLILTKYIYQYFGEIPVRIIAFFVTLTVFLTAKERRRASEKFFKILNKKFVLFHSFLQFLNYGNALVDKFISFLGRLDPARIELPDPEIYHGAFFITTHVGNVEILRSLFQDEKLDHPKRVNVFLQASACERFNNFLHSLELKLNIDAFPVEKVSADTSIMVADRLKQGEIVFMAGDRVSSENTNKVYEAEFLHHRVEFPLGTLRFALMMQVPIYFVVCVKAGKKFKVYTERFVTQKEKKNEILSDMQKAYVQFLEKFTFKYPHQFYNFYDLFKN